MGDGEQPVLKEVDRKHLLNYVSDDSSDDDMEDNFDRDGQDSDDSELNLEKQKEELVMNDTWGKKKQAYYHREDSDASESEEEEDL